MDIVTIQEIQRHARGHFFDDGATRFFNSRYPQLGYKVGDKAYFITSEQFDYNSPRYYTVRVLDYKTGVIDTIGEFNKLTKSEAKTQLNHILKSAS